MINIAPLTSSLRTAIVLLKVSKVDSEKFEGNTRFSFASQEDYPVPIFKSDSASNFEFLADILLNNACLAIKLA